MKFKRILSLALLAAIVFSTVAASAEPLRIRYRSNTPTISRAKPNDIYFEEFIDTKPGEFPPSVTWNNYNGTVTTEERDIGGRTKVCAVIDDTNHAHDYRGPDIAFNFPTQKKGIVGIQMRYQYNATGSSAYSSAIMRGSGRTGTPTQNIVASLNGVLNSAGGTAIEPDRVQSGVWYVLTWVIDFDNRKVDVSLLNESKDRTFYVTNADFFEEAATDINCFMLDLQSYGGTWIIDYFRLSKLTERMKVDYSKIIKGSGEAEIVSAPLNAATFGRTNIKVDGMYQFTTKAPKLSGSEVLITAKNISTIFGMQYYKTLDGWMLKNSGAEFLVSAGGITKGGSPMNLSAACVQEGNQVFVPLKDIAEALGFKYSYDAETNTVEILTGKELPAENAEAVE